MKLQEGSVSCNEKISSIAILVDGAKYQDFPFLTEISSLFNINKGAIQILYFTPDKNIAKQYNETMYCENDLGFRGRFKNEAVNTFINIKKDALLNFYSEDNLLLNLVAVQSKAKFKIGFSGVNELINDLSIATSLENIKEFTFEVNKYLSILKKI